MNALETRRSRIFAMCLIRNEADIVAQCLHSAAKWCDSIFAHDNGSDDGTWEKVLELSSTLKAVIPFKRAAVPFRDSLRGEIFEYYRHQSREGDWWCRLDADELYIDDPRVFLSNIPPGFDLVWSASFQYYFTDKDLQRYESKPNAFDASVPVEEKCRFFINNWSEPRFFRYHPWLDYRQGDWPRPLGRSFPRRIRLKHFQYRSPAQISKRLATRSAAMHAGLFKHETVPDWKVTAPLGRVNIAGGTSLHQPPSWLERIVDSKTLIHDEGNNPYIINESALPPIPAGRSTFRGEQRKSR